MICTNRGGR